jgi:hypothetical protein
VDPIVHSPLRILARHGPRKVVGALLKGLDNLDLLLGVLQQKLASMEAGVLKRVISTHSRSSSCLLLKEVARGVSSSQTFPKKIVLSKFRGFEAFFEV